MAAINRREFLAAVTVAKIADASPPQPGMPGKEAAMAERLAPLDKPRLLGQWAEFEYPDGSVLDGMHAMILVPPGEKIDLVVRIKVDSWDELDLLTGREFADLKCGSD
jgi:hypothetical protein